jgi:hypothetical protein
MTREVVKRLISGGMIETPAAEEVTQRIRQAVAEELGVEDRLNEEVRRILEQHSEEIKRAGASYQEMYKKVKSQLARERKLILR